MPTPRPHEKDIQRAVMDFLAASGFRVFRRNVAGILPMAHGGFMRVGEKGQADLYGWHRETGRHIEVEVKRSGEVPSSDQELWLLMAERNNCIAFWANSVEMAEEKLAVAVAG